MSNQLILSEQFELLKDDLIALYNEKKMRASGKWADSLEVIAGEDTVKLMGEDYTQQLETGRRATGGGSGSAWATPLEDIKQWILDKGVFTAALESISLSSLAFLILRKIHTQGWKREAHGGVELISTVVTDERIQKIINEVGNAQIIQVSSEIIRLIKELEAV